MNENTEKNVTIYVEIEELEQKDSPSFIFPF
jgi:hypothetical protein